MGDNELKELLARAENGDEEAKQKLEKLIKSKH